jgi:hypothetical protein
VDLDLDAAAALCGVDALEVVALVAAGFLEARAGPLVDGSATYRFTRAALRRCPVASASYPVLPDPLPRIVVSLAAALRLLATADADAADAAGRADAGRVRLPQVLAAVQTGALQAFRAAWDRGWSHAPLPLAALWIVRDDVLRYRALAAWRVRDPLQSAAAVCRSLRCTPATLRHLYGRAELVPARDATDLTTIRWQYEPWAVEQFARRHPTDREAAQLLGTTTRAVRRLVEARRLFPVTGPRLDGSACYRVERVDVYRLRDGHLTDAALRDLLSDW